MNTKEGNIDDTIYSYLKECEQYKMDEDKDYIPNENIYQKQRRQYSEDYIQYKQYLEIEKYKKKCDKRNIAYTK